MPTTGIVFPALDELGRQKTVSTKPQDSRKTFYTHDWTDKTTWYTSSVRVANETATCNDGYYTTYFTSHAPVVDTYHGKITQEDFLKDADGYSYRVSVYVDGYQKTEQDPHTATGGDFVFDYDLGSITFSSALTIDNVVTVTYHKVVSSLFIVAPDPGKQLQVTFCECQFSGDVLINDSVVFQPYGLVDAFAPQYLTTNGGPYPPGTKIPLGNPVVYKGMRDFYNDAVRAYPTYPALGGNGWRGMPQPGVVLDWDYVASTVLQSSKGLEIHISLQHDTVFGGTMATASFYCLVEDES